MSPPFRQAPHDPDKAAMSGVTKFIPKRNEPDRSHKCIDCDLTARWQVTVNDVPLYACDDHRKEYAITATTYKEKRL